MSPSSILYFLSQGHHSLKTPGRGEIALILQNWSQHNTYGCLSTFNCGSEVQICKSASCTQDLCVSGTAIPGSSSKFKQATAACQNKRFSTGLFSVLLARSSSSFAQETGHDSSICFKFMLLKWKAKVDLAYREALDGSSQAEAQNHSPR